MRSTWSSSTLGCTLENEQHVPCFYTTVIPCRVCTSKPIVVTLHRCLSFCSESWTVTPRRVICSVKSTSPPRLFSVRVDHGYSPAVCTRSNLSLLCVRLATGRCISREHPSFSPWWLEGRCWRCCCCALLWEGVSVKWMRICAWTVVSGEIGCWDSGYISMWKFLSE